MRVALVSEHASPLATLGGVDAGGQNVHVAALARELARLGAEVVVHTRRDDAALPERVALCDGVEVHHVAAGPPRSLPKDELLPFMPAFGERLRSCWSRRRPEVVHSHFWMSGHACLRVTPQLGLPLAHTFHALGVVKRRYQGAADTSPPERAGIEDAIVRRVDRIVATCTDEAFELLRLGADQRRIAVVPSGVDLERFSPQGPREQRRAAHRLVYAGRLVERKGIGNIVSALRQLPDCELVIAGGPDAAALDGDADVARLRVLAAHEGVADRVVFRGRLEHDALPALLRSADALVTVPWYEPFGITPLEAMACGVPVVGSAVGGLVDTIVDGVTGRHVPPRDPERLAAVLAELLADPAACASYGAAGVRRARELYGWERIGRTTLDVYEQLGESRWRSPLIGAARPARASRGAGASEHAAALADALGRCARELAGAQTWGERLARVLGSGGRLLVAGNGGSAAEAQHLTAELVGRFERERDPLDAICLHAETSSLTAIVNDYGAEQGFARQLRAHGRRGDVLLALSTSGSSGNLLAAAREARALGIAVWAMTGTAPNPLTELSDEFLALDARRVSTVQELQLVAIHVLCGAVDAALAGERTTPAGFEPAAPRARVSA